MLWTQMVQLVQQLTIIGRGRVAPTRNTRTLFALSSLMDLRATTSTTAAITWPPLSPSANTKRIKLTVIKKNQTNLTILTKKGNICQLNLKIVI
jgi:hypothetical protein